MSPTLVRVAIAIALLALVFALLYWRDRHFRQQVDRHILRRKSARTVETKMTSQRLPDHVSIVPKEPDDLNL